MSGPRKDAAPILLDTHQTVVTSAFFNDRLDERMFFRDIAVAARVDHPEVLTAHGIRGIPGPYPKPYEWIGLRNRSLHEGR